MRFRSEVTMPAPPPGRMDGATLLAMRDGPQTSQARESRGQREQAPVRVAAAWLVRRCPA
jgi:hypothetical protein